MLQLAFTVNNFNFNKKKLGRHMDDGTLKIELIIERDDEIVGGIWMVMRLTSDPN